MAWWLVPAGLLLSSCSLLLGWDDVEKPRCDKAKDNQCLDHYSCLYDICVADGSLVRHDTCTKDRQCAGGPDVICANGFTCRMTCDNDDLYGTPAVCLGNEYCKPEEDGEAPGVWRGTCVESECTSHDDCPENPLASRGDTCVPISSMASACVTGCDVTFTAGGEYKDGCPIDTAAEYYCQPIGAPGSEDLICIKYLAAERVAPPFACHEVHKPCVRGAACVGGVCRTYCEAGGTQCTSPQICCPNTNNPSAQVLYSYCAEQCN